MNCPWQEIKSVDIKILNPELWLLDNIAFFKKNYLDTVARVDFDCWVNVDIHNNHIFINGTPGIKDVGELMIQLRGLSGFIIREFWIKTVPKKE